MPNRRWTIALVLIVSMFVGLLLQFSSSFIQIHTLVKPLQTQPASGSDPVHIVLIAQELDNYSWRAIEQGARKAALAYGMELEYIGPDRINPEEQIRLLDKAISAKADAILFQGIDNDEYRRLIRKAAGLGIPMIAVDTDEPGSERLAYVGTDNLGAGRQMGELVAEASGQQGSIGVLISNEQAENQHLRLKGFRSVIEQHPGLHITEIATSDISMLQAAQETQTMLVRYPHMNYMVGFSSSDGLGILDAARRVRPGGVQIFAFDDKIETVEAVHAGNIKLTIVQQPVEMGIQAVQLLHGYWQGSSPPSVTYTGTYVLKADRSESAPRGTTP
ncbi:substrate-binding domain-containing protein [Paenibacillus sp. FSL H7-0350]|uniref:substrate-binding domain-containing protein n=1 Tax=Paenibacillus sp. FSL H7-0350 TaxID=2975345 RepID=UPI0031598E6D